MLRVLLILAFALCSRLLLTAGPASAPGVEAIERAIEHLEMEQAAKLSLQLADTRARLYYQARILFIQYLVAEPPGHMERFISLSKSTLQAYEKLPASDPHREWMMAEVFFMRGVIRALNQQAVTAAVDMKSACDLIMRSSNSHPNIREHQKLTGIFNIAMAAMPKKLQWLGKVLCFKGDLDTGLRQLASVAREGRMMPNEAQVLLFYFEKNLLSRPEAALQRAKVLHERYPQSKIYTYLLLTALLEMRNVDDAITLARLSEPLFRSSKTTMDLPMWHYSVGKAYFFSLEYPDAIRHFDLFLTTYQGKTLRADALYRKAMALLLMNRYDDSKKVFAKFAGLPKSEFDADEYARQQAAGYILRQPSAEDKRLYAARNLFDGGFYERALDSIEPLLLASDRLDENQRTELHYRLGRIQHAQQQTGPAKLSYQACIATQPSSSLWMKVYSFYYLGRIEEEEGNVEKARFLFKTALSYDHYPYQSGLEQRSKAALAELKHVKTSTP